LIHDPSHHRPTSSRAESPLTVQNRGFNLPIWWRAGRAEIPHLRYGGGTLGEEEIDMSTQPPSDTPEAQPAGEQTGDVQLQRRICIPSPGEIIISSLTGNSYVMGNRIGEGNFSYVHQCIDDWDNRLAAKILKPLGRTYEVVKEKATAEMKTLFALRHPYVTYLFDAFEYKDTFYIIQEKCDFPIDTFFTWKDTNLWLWVRPVARCLLQALHFLHLNGFVHQDVHSGNVLSATVQDELMPHGNQVVVFKLGDLGVSKLLADVSLSNTRANWTLPPEIYDAAEFGRVDHRVDIYHAALLLLQIAYSRELRFTKEQVMDGVPRKLAEQIPGPLGSALGRALRRHVASRTSDAMALWRDLRNIEESPKSLMLWSKSLNVLPAVGGDPE